MVKSSGVLVLAFSSTENLLVLLKLFTVAAGFFIVYLGWRAYRTNRQRTVLWMTLGMLVLTFGAISEGAAYQGLQWTLDQSHLFEALVTLMGFGLLVHSLYTK